MTVTVTNLLAGPATDVWVGDFGAAEPATIDAAPGVGFRNIGGTQGGLRLVADRELFRMEVDQIPGRVGSQLTSEDFSVQTSLAEATLENYALVVNAADEAVDATTVPGEKSLDLGTADTVAEPNYRCIIIDGRAPNGKKRRVIIRKVLSTASVETPMQRGGQTVFPVTWTAHYVSQSIAPVRKIDATA